MLWEAEAQLRFLVRGYPVISAAPVKKTLLAFIWSTFYLKTL